MKTNLTKEESAHLISLGVPKEKASDYTYTESKEYRGGIELPPVKVPIFTFTDLLEMLPKEIGNRCCIDISWNFLTEEWSIDYDFIEGSYHSAKELIDSLFELCVWTIENGYLKF